MKPNTHFRQALQILLVLALSGTQAAETPPISVVIAWVNGTDPAFAQRFAEATNTTAQCDRVENSNEIYLSLTAICKHQRWVRQVFVVVDQQTFSLDFLPPGCPKVSILDMSEFVPPQYLPTFNSHVFETFLWRIPGLSEHFIYLNDDMVLAHPIQPAKLFQLTKSDAAAVEPAVTAASGRQPDGDSTAALLRANLKQRDWKVPHPEAEVPPSATWIWPRWNGLELFQSAFDGARPVGFDAHGAYLLTRSAMQETWDKFGPQLERALTHNKKRFYARLADGGDVHFTSLSQQVGVQLGLMATASPITTLVVHHTSDQGLSQYVQSLFNSKVHVVCLQEMRRVSDQDLAKLCGLVADVWCATVPLTTHQRMFGDPCGRLVAKCSRRVHCDSSSGRRRLQLRS